MRATDVVRERALALAAIGRDDDAAVEELVEAAMGRRVAVVLARQELEGRPEAAEHAAAAEALLDRALAAPVWPDRDTV